MWEAVYCLENMWFSGTRLELNVSDFTPKVMGITLDDFIHSNENTMVHKVLNKYASDGRLLYFFSDPPHLLHGTVSICCKVYAGMLDNDVCN